MTPGAKFDVWIYNLARGDARKSISEGSNQFPVWTPDGKRLLVSGDTRRHPKCLLEVGGRQWNRGALDDRGREPGARFVVAGRTRPALHRRHGGRLDILAFKAHRLQEMEPFLGTVVRGRNPAVSPLMGAG